MTQMSSGESSPKADEKAAATKKVRKRQEAEQLKPSGGGQQWTFPKNTLEDAIKVAKAIEEQNGGNPMQAEMLVKAVGFKKSNDWRFLDLLGSANLYGLVSGSGKTATAGPKEHLQDDRR